MYRPLPSIVTIKNSDIEGLGLFATEDIPKGTIIGISHILDSRWENGCIRLPLGGFYNHSETPNMENYSIYNEQYQCWVLMLRTKVDIKSGDELMCTYKLYDPTKY